MTPASQCIIISEFGTILCKIWKCISAVTGCSHMGPMGAAMRPAVLHLTPLQVSHSYNLIFKPRVCYFQTHLHVISVSALTGDSDSEVTSSSDASDSEVSSQQTSSEGMRFSQLHSIISSARHV